MTDLLILDVEARAEREALIEALIIAEFERDTDIEAWIAVVVDALDS